MPTGRPVGTAGTHAKTCNGPTAPAQLVDDGARVDDAVRIVSLEYRLATAQAMIETLRRRPEH